MMSIDRKKEGNKKECVFFFGGGFGLLPKK